MTLRAAFEVTDLLRTRSLKPSFEAVAFCNVLIILAAWSHLRLPEKPDAQTMLQSSLGIVAAAVFASFLLLMLVEAVRYRAPGQSMESLGANLISVMYTGGLLAVFAQFRWFPNHTTAYFAMGSVIIATKSGDIMAYTFGRLWGRRRMVPLLSPGKTWMGGFGAVVGSCLGGWLWLKFGARLFSTPLEMGELSNVLAYCGTMGVVGLIGDLCESLIKRDAQKKDSASLLPGFGGLLDLLDSPLYAAPVALAWWYFCPPVV
ncbi:MAG: phosphatidate cytidylyltransferase [Planctomycetaceae bacterium]